jgi:predicted Holliday junction resolvase-like endonuclease
MYEALSYCWGDALNLQRILVTDQADTEFRYLGVTVNLFAAFQRVKDPDMSRTLWIDALCSDQSNMEEREQQVGLMATIYSKE